MVVKSIVVAVVCKSESARSDASQSALIHLNFDVRQKHGTQFDRETGMVCTCIIGLTGPLIGWSEPTAGVATDSEHYPSVDTATVNIPQLTVQLSCSLNSLLETCRVGLAVH